MWTYYHWIRNNVTANTPWDRFVRQLVTAKGSTLENGAANFYALHEDPPNLAETVSQAFLGMSINCARCHNHPMEKWTNDEYFGFVNRIWANFYGVGLVEKVDDLRVTNPASNEQLLRAAADYLAAQQFNLKALIRAILQSETYQRSSQVLPENADDRRFYSHYYPR